MQQLLCKLKIANHNARKIKKINSLLPLITKPKAKLFPVYRVYGNLILLL